MIKHHSHTQHLERRAAPLGQIITARGHREGRDARLTTRQALRLAGVLVLCAFAAVPATAQASRTSGDFNCDGIDDLAIGVPTENVPKGATLNTDAGAVNVIYGSANRLTASAYQSVPANQVWTQQDLAGGAEIADRFGSAVAAGDFDGDGCEDLAVGVPGENLPFNGGNVSDAGAVNVIEGSPTGLTATGNTLWSQDPLAGTPQAGDAFGSALTTGRLNGLGSDDLVVGVPGEDDGSGAVNVVYGNGGLTSAGNSVRTQSNAEDNDGYGTTLASGDFDDDGYDDVAIGVPGENVEGPPLKVDSGVVNVIYGSTFSLSTTRLAEHHQIHDNSDAGDRFGSALTTGNFDDDEYLDLAVGAPGEDGDSGAVSVIYGDGEFGLSVDRAQFWTQASPDVSGAPQAGDLFGSSLAAGDLNPGGVDDLAIGVPGEDLDSGTSPANGGAVHVLYGVADYGVNQQGQQLWTQDSPSLAGDDAQTSDAFGTSLTTGNFNPDGFEDLAIGVPGEDVISGSGSVTNAGAVNVIYGALFGLTVSGNQFWSQAVLAGSLGGGDGFGAALPT